MFKALNCQAIFYRDQLPTHLSVRSHHLAAILMRDTEVYESKERAWGHHLITFSSLQKYFMMLANQ